MLKPTLDPRLLTAADFFPYCKYGADIGADHGHLSCYLLSTGKCQHMQVTDISRASLEKARILMQRHGLEGKAQLLQGDGLHALVHPAQAIAICGMGGHTLSEILQNGKEKLQEASLVLSPQTEIPLVRQVLYEELHYYIAKETVVQAAGRFYVIILAVPGERGLDEKACYIGPELMKNTDETYLAYLQWRYQVVACERAARTSQHLNWIEEEIERVKAFIDCR